MFKLIRVFFGTRGPKYHWKKVVAILAISTFCISGSAAASYLIYRYVSFQAASSASNVIEAIIQTTPQTGLNLTQLPTTYFAEVLSLSADQPAFLSQFDVDEAKKKLLSTHVIQEVSLKKMKPDLLFIQYRTRVPYVLLADFSNTAIDEEGTLFPYAPYFSPRHLPRIYLGEELTGKPWGKKIDPKRLNWVHTLVALLGREKVERIDLSQADASLEGRREMVVNLKEGTLLRLNPKSYVQQLANYFILKRSFLEKERAAIIDLRIEEVAYILEL